MKQDLFGVSRFWNAIVFDTNGGGGSSGGSSSSSNDDDGPQLSASAQSQVGNVQQDENGNWYAVKQIEGTNALGRDYSIDPKDNSQGPTFGKNVSKNVEETFPEEVAAAGGSSDYVGSILDTFEDTDVDSLGYDPATETYTPPEPVVETPSDIAQPGDLDLPEVDVFQLDPFIPVGGPGTFSPGSLPADTLSTQEISDLVNSALDNVEDDEPLFFRPGQGGFDVQGFDTGTGLLLEGSGALTTKMLGNFISAMEDLGGLPSLGFTGVQEFGEDLRAQGEATKLEVLGKLQTDAPDTFDALNRPIMGDDGFDFEALAAKGYYSSIPTILGLSGIPFGVTAALVTGGIMTGAEVGTEARDDTYNTAIEMGYSEAEAETLSRSASTMATALGMPIGGLSNILFSTVLPGSGAGSIATVAGNIVEEAVTEGYIEQNAAALAVDEMLGTDRFGKAYNIDEGIVGALVGGGVTLATINNAINKAIDSPAQTGGEASAGGPSATDLATASEILNSGADVSIVTDSNGDLIITDTGTGQSVNVGSVISSSVPISGSETTAADLTAAEQSVVSGASDVTINSTGAGITLTNNKTGFTAVVSPGSNTSVMDVVTAVETNDSTGVTNAGATVSTGTDGTGITTLVPGTTDTTETNTGVTTTAGADSTTTTVGVGSTETITSGDTQITTSVDTNGNTTVTTTNTNTGVAETTTVPANTSTTISSGVTEVTVNATNTGATTTAVTNTDTTSTAVTDATTNIPAAVTNVTDVGTITTFTDDDFTADTTFTPTTEFTPEDDDDEVPPVGEQIPGYTSGIAGLSGARPTVAPYYQPQQTGQYSFYVPQPGVDQTVPAGPVFSDPTSYLAPTASPQYGYGYIAPNAELEYLRRLAEIQGTGDEKLPSENLMDGS